MEEKVASDTTPWSTWEELLLCAAVFRHGNQDWKIVNSELLSRALSPLNAIFTPEICKAKYEEFTQQYPLRKVWYDELRKKRIMELKQALEDSDDSIGDGSNQETGDSIQFDAGKTSCEDSLSAGSFTQDEKAEPSVSSPRIDPLDAVLRGFSKGRRGGRRRKLEVEENCGSCCSTSEIDNLMSVFNSIADEKCASFFRRRLDCQKRGRYKKMIIRHVDFDSIRSNIASGSTKTGEEVFRDLLLLANNALVFYSKNTREYKSALLLREIISSHLTNHLKDYVGKSKIAAVSSSASPEVDGTSVNVIGNVAVKVEKRLRLQNSCVLGSLPASKKEVCTSRRGSVAGRS